MNLKTINASNRQRRSIIPRWSTTVRDAYTAEVGPALMGSMLIYNTTTNTYQYHNTITWVEWGGGGGGGGFQWPSNLAYVNMIQVPIGTLPDNLNPSVMPDDIGKFLRLQRVGDTHEYLPVPYTTSTSTVGIKTTYRITVHTTPDPADFIMVGDVDNSFEGVAIGGIPGYTNGMTAEAFTTLLTNFINTSPPFTGRFSVVGTPAPTSFNIITDNVPDKHSNIMLFQFIAANKLGAYTVEVELLNPGHPGESLSLSLHPVLGILHSIENIGPTPSDNVANVICGDNITIAMPYSDEVGIPAISNVWGNNMFVVPDDGGSNLRLQNYRIESSFGFIKALGFAGRNKINISMNNLRIRYNDLVTGLIY